MKNADRAGALRHRSRTGQTLAFARVAKCAAAKCAAAICAATMCAAATAPQAAMARHLRHGAKARRTERVLVVHPRSFTDSGVVAPVGSRDRYMAPMTQFNAMPYETSAPGVFWRPDPWIFR
ncbi:MAG: hypothetical protein KGL46_09030 [Hyphomicrobiales bacterium]|nr:hypothetical protein [Hyphomicrobiales bacterium]